MMWLISGLLLWTVVHWVPAIWPALKASWRNKLGAAGYQGSFALLVLSGLLLIVLGWRQTPATQVYLPMTELRHPAMALVVLGFVLMGAANYGSRIKRLIRHPQLTGFALWAVAHLLLNGDNKSVLVFTWLLLWAISEIILINRRDPEFTPPAVVSWPKELAGMLVSFGVVALVVWIHPYLSGRAIVLLRIPDLRMILSIG